MKITPVLFLIILSLLGCDNSACDDPLNVKDKITPLSIQRLDEKLPKTKNQQAAERFLTEHADLRTFLEKRSEPVSLILYATEPRYDTIKNLIENEFSAAQLQPVEEDLAAAFAHLKHYYPIFEVPEVKTVFTGFGPVIIATENKSLFIGLEYFLGFKPPLADLPIYLFQHFTPQNIAPKVVMNYARHYEAYDIDDQTVLNEIIAWGKEYYFTKQMMPCAHDSLILEQTPASLEFMENYTGKIWKYFVTNELFYKIDRETKRKFIDPRPHCIEMADNCPGMVGRWLGYKIIHDYMKNHPDISLQQLMLEKNAQKLFADSGFKPKIQ